MDPIQKAVEDIKSRKPGEDFTYTQVAKQYGVDRRTLTRRHQGQNQPHRLAHLKLHPQQEKELVKYIKRPFKRRTPPTREMIRNFASSLAHREVSDSWVARFINRSSSHLISSWQTGMDRNHHQADSGAKYNLYLIYYTRRWRNTRLSQGISTIGMRRASL
jgi:hypothetical protein